MALTADFEKVEVDLSGIGLQNPTSLQFGPDGRLYVSQQNGLIRSVNLQAQRNSIGGGFEIDKFVIDNVGGADVTDLVQDIPNHNDNGDLNPSVNSRLVTGILVEEGDNGEVILYVSSSDPRIGGGFSGGDKGLDTNSGIISRLTKTGNSTWEKVDLVIGLPRSEENHANNGMDIRTEIVNGQPHQIMYVASGGSTNKGAPSNNFAWTPEYYYSAAVLRIDLTQLEQIEATEGLKGGTNYVDEYVYALPTLNDPTRPDNGQGQDTANGTTGPADAEAADTFGGNDGRNQAKYDPNGPVQVYSSGYRNAYDIVITENNNIYTFDNGPNDGWGDKPLDASGNPINNSSQVATNKPNINVNTGNDSAPDNLHLVTEGFYGGHPNPVYASGPAAGLYWVDTSSGSPVVKQLTNPNDPSNDPNTKLDDLPSDWNTIAGGFTNPEAGVYLSSGSNSSGTNKGPDGSLVTIGSSTNGLAEYRAGKTTGSYPVTNVPGAEVLMAVSFNQNLYFMEIVGDGTQAGTKLTDIEQITVGGTPLDVRDVEAFAVGTQDFKDAIFIAQFGSNDITALVPGVIPPTDVDKDNDGLNDNIDPLQYDPDNGTNTLLNPGEILFWDLNPIGNHPGPSGDYNIGMTGWMINGSWFLEEDGIAPADDPNRFIDPALVDLNNTIRGGAPGIVQVKATTTGNLEGTGNDQQDAIQTGFLPGADVSQFTIKVPIFNPFTSDANNGVTFSESASMGFSLGDGTMSNWIGITVAADDSSGAQVKLTYEENDSTITSLSVDAPELLTAVDDDQVELFLTVDKIDANTYEVTPSWRYQTQGSWSAINQLGSSPVELNSQGAIVEALQGEKLINNIESAPVVTLISTSKGAQPFTADFLDLTISSADNDSPSSSILIEAEDAQTIVNYRTENLSVASGNEVLSFLGDGTNEVGSATFGFNRAGGNYNIIVGTFDENDGLAQFVLELNDIETGITSEIGSLVLDDNLGSNAANGQTAVSPTVAFGVSLTTGDTITVNGFEDGNEHARFDYIRFEPVEGMTPVAPVISAPASVTVSENQTFVVDVNATDVNGGPLTYSLTNGDDQGDFTINSSTGVLSFIQAPDFEAPGDNGGNNVYEVEVTVTDPGGLFDTQAIAVTVTDVNETPGGNPLQIEAEDINNVSGYRIENNSVASGGSMLSLVGENGDEMGTATFNFGGTSGNYNVFIGAFDENDGNASIDVIQGGSTIGTALLNQSPGGNAATADTKVEKTVATGVLINNGTSLTIKGNEDGGEHARFDYIRFEPVGSMTPVAPVISAPSSVTVSENQTFVLDLNATDVNGGPLTYSLTNGDDQGDFTINSSTGVLSFIQAPDFENPGDNGGNNVYEVEVTVTDPGGLFDTQAIAVTVSDANETPGVTPIKIEAEDIDNVTGYRIENNSVASGGSMLSLVGGNNGEIGTASFNFGGTSGNYNVFIGAFDENDGQTSFTLDLNGSEIGQVVLDDQLGSNVANSNTFVTLELGSGVQLQQGDVLTITGLEDASEHARFDFVEFTPVP